MKDKMLLKLERDRYQVKNETLNESVDGLEKKVKDQKKSMSKSNLVNDSKISVNSKA